jgi:hypothetical protein
MPLDLTDRISVLISLATLAALAVVMLRETLRNARQQRSIRRSMGFGYPPAHERRALDNLLADIERFEGPEHAYRDARVPACGEVNEIDPKLLSK